MMMITAVTEAPRATAKTSPSTSQRGPINLPLQEQLRSPLTIEHSPLQRQTIVNECRLAPGTSSVL